jgi:BlaI family transcriptional regulator, penicillinase repressor
METTFGERELDVLSVLWKHGAGTVPEVRERLGSDLAYNTVLTVLRNLEAKGVVSHEEAGRQHRYFAVVAEDRVQQRLVTRLVDKLFSGSPLNLMAHLVEGDGLTADDVRALQQLLDERIASRHHKPE